MQTYKIGTTVIPLAAVGLPLFYNGAIYGYRSESYLKIAKIIWSELQGDMK